MLVLRLHGRVGAVMRDLRALIDDIRAAGDVTDNAFDRIYPPWVRRASDMHWTPYEVARRAIELLVVDAGTRVLDVGSGAGKLCLVGALVSEGLFFGVEQRAGLVRVAEQAALRCGATRARFIHSNITEIDWRSFDAFYLYNPFYEHIAEVSPLIEEPIDRSHELFDQYVTTTTINLFHAPVGTRVVTYQGFGGPLPAGYRRLAQELFDGHALELWLKESLTAALETPQRRLRDVT